MTWYSFSYETNYENQQRIIKQLRPYIKDWISLGLARGFNYNHYAGDPDKPDHLSLRLDIRDSASEGKIEVTLKSVGITIKKEEYESATAAEKYGYELGSKLAFLIFYCMETGSIHEDLLKDPNFWFNIIHGFINSSGMVEVNNAQQKLKEYCEKLRFVADV